MDAEKIPIKEEKQELTFEEKCEIYDQTLQKGCIISNAELRKLPLLNKEEEIEVAQRIEQGEKQFKKYFFLANLRLVAKKAGEHYRSRGRHHCFEEDDFMQEGTFGLMKAIEKFDYKKGYKFSTYASWWIDQSMKRAIDESGKMIRFPVGFTEKLIKYKKTHEILIKELSREPTIEEIAEEMEISLEKANDLKNKSKQTIISIDKSATDEDGDHYWKSRLEDINEKDPEEIVSQESNKQAIEDILDNLKPREKEIIEARFGFYNNKPQSLDAIGQKYGLTRERIRQIEARVLTKIKTTLVHKENKTTIQIIENFSPTEKKVLGLRFGLINGKPIEKKFVALELGLSTKEIDIIEKKGLKEMASYYLKDSF